MKLQTFKLSKKWALKSLWDEHKLEPGPWISNGHCALLAEAISAPAVTKLLAIPHDDRYEPTKQQSLLELLYGAEKKSIYLAQSAEQVHHDDFSEEEKKIAKSFATAGKGAVSIRLSAWNEKEEFSVYLSERIYHIMSLLDYDEIGAADEISPLVFYRKSLPVGLAVPVRML